MATRTSRRVGEVTLRASFFNDKRFQLLAAHCAEPERVVRMRVVELWHTCYERNQDVLTAREVDFAVAWAGDIPFSELMQRAGLAELVSATDGTYRVRGVRSTPTNDACRQAQTNTRAAVLIAAYCSAFKSRWGVNPVIAPKDAGIAKRAAEVVAASGEDPGALLQTYLSMTTPMLLRARHPLALFERDFNAVLVVHKAGGRDLSTADIHSLEQRASLGRWVQEASRP